MPESVREVPPVPATGDGVARDAVHVRGDGPVVRRGERRLLRARDEVPDVEVLVRDLGGVQGECLRRPGCRQVSRSAGREARGRTRVTSLA
jgi:hypothetical protein